MKVEEPGKDGATLVSESRRLTRREVLREMGKAVYAAPLLVPLKPPGNSPQLGSQPPPPP